MIKFILKWLLRLAVLAVALIVIFLFSYNSILRVIIEHNIRKQTGLDAEIGRFHLSLLEPTIEIQDLKLYNPTNFAGTPFLDISEIHIEYDPVALKNKRQLHIALLRLNLAELDIVKNQKGDLNIPALGGKLPAKGTNVPIINFKQQTDYDFTGIDTLNFSFGKEKFIDLQDRSKDYEQTVGIQNCIVPHVKSMNDLDGLDLLVALHSTDFSKRLAEINSQSGNADTLRDVLKFFGATF